ncbi:MAG TPA: hypothetical protein VJ890_22035 [Vineibacter sp.]|nr:hypothetical protein [Vineibacter sp.]
MGTILRHPRASVIWASRRVEQLERELNILLRYQQCGDGLHDLVDCLAHAVEHREHVARWVMLAACGCDVVAPGPPFQRGDNPLGGAAGSCVTRLVHT